MTGLHRGSLSEFEGLAGMIDRLSRKGHSTGLYEPLSLPCTGWYDRGLVVVHVVVLRGGRTAPCDTSTGFSGKRAVSIPSGPASARFLYLEIEMAVIFRIEHWPEPRRFGTGPTILMDTLPETISPVDGSVISTRAERAEHNRRCGVIDLAPGDLKHMERSRYPIEPSDARARPGALE